jgi:hypothetical protein
MHIGNKTNDALFFTAPLKRVVGCVALGGAVRREKRRLPFYQNGYGIGYLT